MARGGLVAPSPNSGNSNNAWNVNSDGSLDNYNNVDNSNNSVRPRLRFSEGISYPGQASATPGGLPAEREGSAHPGRRLATNWPRETAAFETMDYEEIFTFPNLLKAHRKTKKGKLWKEEVEMFDLDKGHELYLLSEELRKKAYRVSPYKTFHIYEPKKRRVDATGYRDRVVQNCLVDNYLYPLLDEALIEDNAACRKGKGTDYARRRLILFLQEAYKTYGDDFYVLSFDIHHYFESIDHGTLKEKLKGIIHDEDALSFLSMVIDSFGEEKGLPLGNQTSQCFALYYLDAVDHLIKKGSPWYTRYMDDGIVLSGDRESLKRILRILKNELFSLKLSFNMTKTGVFPVKQGVTYLGFTYHLRRDGKLIARMASKKKRRLNRYLSKASLPYETLLSYRNYLRLRSNEYGLIAKIERLMAEADRGF